jgi:hypothetical protein
VEGDRSAGSGRAQKHHAVGKASLDAAALPTAGLDLPPSMLDMLPKLEQCTGTLDEQRLCYAIAVSHNASSEPRLSNPAADCAVMLDTSPCRLRFSRSLHLPA